MVFVWLRYLPGILNPKPEHESQIRTWEFEDFNYTGTMYNDLPDGIGVAKEFGGSTYDG